MNPRARLTLSGLAITAGGSLIALSVCMDPLSAAEPSQVPSAASLATVGANFHVGGSGEPDRFGTLEEARDAIRELRKSKSLPKGGVTVWIAGGDYRLPATFALTREDSGEKGAPVIYRPIRGQKVTLHANTPIDPSLWRPLSDTAARRLHPAVNRSQLVELDLTKLNLKRVRQFAPGTRFSDQWHIIDLFANGSRQPVSQWPNPDENIGNKNDPGWTTMNGSKDHASFFFGAGGNPADRDGSNESEIDKSNRAKRWHASLAAGHEIWLKGFWRTPWEPHTIKVAEIDPRETWIRLAETPPGGMGSKYTKQAATNPVWRVGSGRENWQAINLLDEIDQPGEWALDVKDRKIYYLPPGPIADLKVSVADRDTPVIRLDGASHIRITGLAIHGGMGHGIEILSGSDNLIAGCDISNIGNSGIRLQGGFRNTIQSNDIHDGAGLGIELSSLGDLGKLIHSDTVILNNHIHHVGRLAFREAIRINHCIGGTVSHNLMHDLPKGAVRSDIMNDFLFEFNEVHNIALRESDTGSFYNYGGWTTYGNLWRYNFLHHTNRANGFYSDDGDSGDTYVKNIVHGSINGILFGGGHHNLATHNLFIENKVQSVDDRGISRGYRIEGAYGKRLLAMKPGVEPWKSYGVRLAERCGYRAHLWSDILDPGWKPEHPNGTVVADNVGIASGIFRAPANRGVEVRDNLTLASVAEAGFRDYKAMDLRTEDPRILARFPELNTIFPRIGLKVDAYRTRVPSRSEHGGLSNRGAEGDLADEDPLK